MLAEVGQQPVAKQLAMMIKDGVHQLPPIRRKLLRLLLCSWNIFMQQQSQALPRSGYIRWSKEILGMGVNKNQPSILVRRSTEGIAARPASLSFDQIVLDALHIILRANGGDERNTARIFRVGGGHQCQPSSEAESKHSDLLPVAP